MFIFGLTEDDLKPVIDLCMIFYTGFCNGPKEVMTSLGFVWVLKICLTGHQNSGGSSVLLIQLYNSQTT